MSFDSNRQTSEPNGPASSRRGAPEPQASDLLELSREECLRLLGSHGFGRLGVSLGEGAPVIRPVNYIFDSRSQAVVFRTALGSKLHAVLRSRHAVFEIDGIDEGFRTGWSVIVHGMADEVTNPNELRRLDRLGLAPWAPGRKAHWVQIRAFTVSGRRIVLAADRPPGWWA